MKYINKTHSVEIYVNGEMIEFFSQEKLNLRFNSVFANPTKIQTTSAEYSFTFTLPITEKNNKIFDFANVPSKRSKFNKRYPTTVSVDGILIFNGEIIISSVDTEGYKCNLYINRLNTVETIFGDSLMTDISGWEMEYHQDTTINEYNSKTDISYPQDCFFPLVSYGMFQKQQSSGGTYTPKHTIDNNNRFYNESFYPSINLLKLVKKCFEHKGYEVNGDIFDDEVARHIFTSTQLADQQDPKYNYGLDEMGKVEVGFNFSSVNGTISSAGTANVATYVPFSVDDDMKITLTDSEGNEGSVYEYNNVYDVWSQKSDFLTITGGENKNLWRENMIVAPTDGYYKIKLTYTMEIPSSFSAYPCYTYGRSTSSGIHAVEKQEYTPKTTFEDHWTELQLVRNNSDEGCGMITPYTIGGDSTFSRQGLPTGAVGKSINVYPHEAQTLKDNQYLCYSPKSEISVLAFDPRVDKHFVMGQCAAEPYYFQSVIKNGRSWDSSCSEENKAKYVCDGYNGWTKEFRQSSLGRGGSYVYTSTSTDYNKNSLGNGTMSLSVLNKKKVTGNIQAIVYLKKNDYLQLKLIQRHWTNKVQDDESSSSGGRRSSAIYSTSTEYMTDAHINLTGSIMFQAYAPENIKISNDSAFDFSTPSKFNTKLDLSEFLKNDEKMSDFINNFIKEFNLSYSQNGKVITLNKQKINMGADKMAIDLTDRVSDDDYSLEAIDYPSKMYVAYSIADDERGVYTSAEKNATDEQIQSNNWVDYADKGYTKVEMMDDEYASEESASTKTSYNWYEDFLLTYDNQNTTISIPIQAKDEWMIEGYKYEDMMKKDGYGLKRRYWFPSGKTTNYVALANQPSRKVYIYLCKPIYDGCELSYKLPVISNEVQAINQEIQDLNKQIATYNNQKKAYQEDMSQLYKTGSIIDSGYPIYSSLPTHTNEDSVWVTTQTLVDGYYPCDFYYWDYYSNRWVLNDVKSTLLKYPVDDTKYCFGCETYSELMRQNSLAINSCNTYIKATQYQINDLEAEIEEKGENGSSASETLLTRYFNVFFDCDTNYISFDAYLTTEEYLAIKNGSNIVVDDDVYIVTEMEGYDVSGNNTTKITAIKK